MTTASDLAPKAPMICIDWPFGAPAPSLHCPRTGKLVLSANDIIEQPASPYVSFLYINEVGEFEYICPELENKLEAERDRMIKAGTDADDLPSDIEILTQRLELGVAPLVFEITTSGMGCGPVSSTVTVGFDLWSDDEHQPE